MSDLRIRSEAIPEAAWPQAFLPPQARVEDRFDDSDDEGDFRAFMAAAARGLKALFGVAIDVAPGRPPPAEPGAARPGVAPELAALLATLRMGGDPARPQAAGGVAMARYARMIGAALDVAAARAWPAGCRSPGIDIDVSWGAVVGHAFVSAPPLVVPEPLPIEAEPAARPRLFDLPMRVRVELASDMTPVASLLPLRAGTILLITPVPEMPLLVGDHVIGRATVTPLPDGRQQASIVAIRVEQLGARP